MGLEVREGYFGSRGLPGFSYVSWGTFVSSPGGIRWVGTGHSWTEERQGTLQLPYMFPWVSDFLCGGCKGARLADVPGKGLGATLGKRPYDLLSLPLCRCSRSPGFILEQDFLCLVISVLPSADLSTVFADPPIGRANLYLLNLCSYHPARTL